MSASPSIRGDARPVSRALETLHVDKALPSLGQALDMHDSRPAEKFSTGPREFGGSTPHGSGLTELQSFDCK